MTTVTTPAKERKKKCYIPSAIKIKTRMNFAAFCFWPFWAVLGSTENSAKNPFLGLGKTVLKENRVIGVF